MSLSISIALVIAVASPPLELRPAEPATTCPPPSEIASALRAHLQVAASQAPWSLGYATTPAGAEGAPTLQLELRDPRQAVRLRRALSLSPDGCAAAAEAMALVVERFFSSIGWTSGAPPVTAPAAVVAVAAPAPRPLLIWAGAAAVHEATWTARAALDLRWRAARPVVFGVGLLLPGRVRSEAVGSARVEATGWPVRASLLFGGDVGRGLAIEGGPDALVALESARAEGVAGPGDGRRLVAELGLAAVASWALPGRWFLGVEAGGYRHVGSGFFITDGQQARRVLEPAAWQAAFLLRLGFALVR
jgi:hypothetical protein